MQHTILRAASVLALTFLLPVSCTGRRDSSLTSTPAPPATAARATPTASALGSTPPPEGGSGGSGGETLTRAERDERYERVRQEFPREPLARQTPRARPRPRTIEAARALGGYEDVSRMVPMSSSLESVQTGQEMFARICAPCHQPDGKPKEDVYTRSLVGYNMADLSDPGQYKYGADARGIFRSIAFGTPAPPHGRYKDALSDQEMWNLTNFVLSLQTL